VALQWLGHSKHTGTQAVYPWFGPLSPTSSSIVFFVLGSPSRVSTERVCKGIIWCYLWALGFGFYLGLIMRSKHLGSDPFYRSPCLPSYT
jgi:hypothetical protein